MRKICSNWLLVSSLRATGIIADSTYNDLLNSLPGAFDTFCLSEQLLRPLADAQRGRDNRREAAKNSSKANGPRKRRVCLMSAATLSGVSTAVFPLPFRLFSTAQWSASGSRASGAA